MKSLNQGACGLDCQICEARIATENNDNQLREKVAKEWSEMYQANIQPENVNCTGCMKEGIKFAHCNECNIRSCVIDHKINHCAECSDFACEKIQSFMNMVECAKNNLMELKQ
ncbi:MAG TPA: DUF3795 domain-containing protein [Candidatus Cloacimonadota bacterium]|nr:DUF3795 domain-containing protein [Candidatus Cloacimonadota bacterium]HOD53375.1 DUF3795 domain-containing protein [Candidatus Cloacimonadota bacterium]HPM01581.1 DUF3795 domain-containing protein [Candidatus Cloacimonadota bacterium]